jgi:hypothetical protein
MPLKAFRSVTLNPGEKKTVEFVITPNMLSMLNVDMHCVVEPGVFELMIGPSSDQTSTVRLAVVGVHSETGRLLAPPPRESSGVVGGVDDDGKDSAN